MYVIFLSFSSLALFSFILSTSIALASSLFVMSHSCLAFLLLINALPYLTIFLFTPLVLCCLSKEIIYPNLRLSSFITSHSSFLSAPFTSLILLFFFIYLAVYTLLPSLPRFSPQSSIFSLLFCLLYRLFLYSFISSNLQFFPCFPRLLTLLFSEHFPCFIFILH